MMAKFRKKPVVIEAWQFTDAYEGFKIVKHLNVVRSWKLGLHAEQKGDSILIPTLEGVMEASLGDWIIQGVNGEFYPCKPDIFEKTYEPA